MAKILLQLLYSFTCHSLIFWYKVRFQVFPVAPMRITVFWHVTLCSLIECYQHCGGTCCLHLLGMEAASTSETSVKIYHTKQHHIQDNSKVLVHLLFLIFRITNNHYACNYASSFLSAWLLYLQYILYLESIWFHFDPRSNNVFTCGNTWHKGLITWILRKFYLFKVKDHVNFEIKQNSPIRQTSESMKKPREVWETGNLHSLWQ
jgi:hypothetical protein